MWKINIARGFMKGVEFKYIVLIPMLLLIIIINGMDFINDIQEGDEWLHIGLQIITLGLSTLGLVLIIRLIIQRQKEAINFQKKIKKAEKDLSLSKIKLREIGQEYRKYIYEQFKEWKLTPSEQEVALLTLKGLSFKEIAEIRKTKDKTVRQQATMIYRKSAVSGRHEFSAWFFEDILH
jgi:DNA-binding CsgD family transcriptional regulator